MAYKNKITKINQFLDSTEVSQFNPPQPSIEESSKNDAIDGDECTDWIQGGCPLGSNMLINICDDNKTNAFRDHGNRMLLDKYQRKPTTIHGHRTIGKSISLFLLFLCS